MKDRRNSPSVGEAVAVHPEPGMRRVARGAVPLRLAFGQFSAVADPYVLYTATLAPIVVAVALLARRPGEIGWALSLSGLAIATQYVLSRWRPLRDSSLPWQLARIGVAMVYVTACVQLIGGPALPLLGLYVLIVAAAAAVGAAQGWITATVAAALYLLPELGELGSPAAVALRGVTLAGVALVLAFGTRRIVAALEAAVREARAAVVAERKRRRQIDALDAVGRLLAAGGVSPAMLDQVIRLVVRRFRYEHVSIYLGDEARVELSSQVGYPEALPAFDPSLGVAGRVMRTRQIALVPDVRSDPDYVAGTIAATSLITAPLLAGHRFLGVLNVETSGDRRLNETDRSVVGIIASRIASAIALGQDHGAIEARTRLFRDIAAFAAEVAASLALDPLATVIATGVRNVVPADVALVALLDRADGTYAIRGVSGSGTTATPIPVDLRTGIAGRAIRERSSVLIEEPSVVEGMATSIATISDGLALPLVHDGVAVGALTALRLAPGGPFSDLERDGLELVARHASLAIANAFLHQEVTELAVRDGLTGLYNRRYFDETLDRMLAARRRTRLETAKPLSAILFDLDRFGDFNKQHGHQVGDTVLRAFAEVLSSRLRAFDLVARLGGEEFIVVLDGTSREGAFLIADEIRAAIASRPIQSHDGTQLHVTVSAGCAALDDANPTRDALLRTADVALFMAKRAGRDRVVAA